MGSTKAGGGSAHRTSADLSSPVLQSALEKIARSLSSIDFPSIQNDPSAPTNPDLSSLIKYLSSPTHTIVALPSKKDWSRPFNEYFISSSHNTYLTGHQLYGDSTVDGYINVLTRGCRCIEIDVWDGDDGEPEVFHGYTLTKEIKFKKVCQAIMDHAFSEEVGEEAKDEEKFEGPGNGPVIISLECHAGHEQQERMVEIMEKVFKERLVKGIEPEDVKALPSPDDLRGKIVVKPDGPAKAKYVAPTAEEKALKSATEGLEELTVNAPIRTSTKSSSYSLDTSSSSDSELEELSKKANKSKPKKSKVIRALTRLGAYCSSHHFPSNHPSPFLLAPTSQIPNHVYSFSEKAFSKHHQNHAAEIFEHNKNYLMRVYPFGLRFGSSNQTPDQFWARGVQLVALNWQKCDEGMMLNEGMFSGEGGYVLKPAEMRPSGGANEVIRGFDALKKWKLDLKVHVIAGANIPLPDEDDKVKSFEPYVKVEVHPTGGVDLEIKRKTKAKRGIECTWDELLEFKGVEGVVPELSFVRFKIHDKEFGKDDLSSWACVRVDRLQTGYRVVRLFDSEGNHSKGVILVKVEKRLY